jgi:A/G-specific adenine glycosylase
VGQYVANAVLLFAHGRREPLLDVNVARVLERHFGPRRLADIRYDPYLQALARMVVSSKHPAKVNWALLDLAALICRIRAPLCQECPLSATCRDYARRRNSADDGSEAGAVA